MYCISGASFKFFKRLIKFVNGPKMSLYHIITYTSVCKREYYTRRFMYYFVKYKYKYQLIKLVNLLSM